ncbi:S8 family serine peptidase [Ruminiclostridium herbifermentans]|uniref:S8 family serine peptidase n=1 Tax=Ruminiclostridium herbifermentans TaxID=2488810 RepID=A0A4U7JC66_9FIRM|nr:S8 family serine peptidase [Ruminiclostridium herbifermentans]QNU67997.1 S8 family serine peptidase [Ruminiclostridium herbifermentans]
MADKIHIAILDDGVVSGVYVNIENSLYVDEENNIRQYTNHSETISHGTICAIVLKSYAPDILLSSIKILQSEGIGRIEKLYPALQWCLDNNVKIVSLSLGSTHFMDYALIRSIINDYTNKGIVIVSAGSNSGYTSYPAYFSNVIGVASCSNEVTDRYYNFVSDIHTGIDIEAVSFCGITINNQKIDIPRSNSYEAPFITAKVSEIISSNPFLSIYQIKKKLIQYSANFNDTVKICNNPDWISCAYISDKTKLKSKASLYFTSFTESNYQHVKDKVDTIIVFSHQDVEFYKNENKKIVYIGDGYMINEEEMIDYFWCSEYKNLQIENCKDKNYCMDVPLIIINLDKNMDELWILQKLRNLFAEEAYNIYASSVIAQCVLYDLEYIPFKYIKCEHLNKKLFQFLCGEVYYKKVDAVVIGASGKGEVLERFASITDAQLKVNIIKTDTYKVMLCDNIGNIEAIEYGDMDETAITSIYRHIHNMLIGEAANE